MFEFRIKPVCPLCKCSLELLKHRLWIGSNILPNWDNEGQMYEFFKNLFRNFLLNFSENIMELRSEYELERLMEKSSRPPEHERQAVIHLIKSLLGELYTLRNMHITTYARFTYF